MPVIIKNLVVNAEIGKAEVRNAVSPRNNGNSEQHRNRIIKEEELTERVIQILKDQKER